MLQTRFIYYYAFYSGCIYQFVPYRRYIVHTFKNRDFGTSAVNDKMVFNRTEGSSIVVIVYKLDYELLALDF